MRLKYYLPPEILVLATLIYNYISSGASRTNKWRIAQLSLLVPALRILQACATRWLATYACIQRLVRRWTALIIFFQVEASKDQEGAKRILEMLLDPKIKAYYLFLEAALSRLVKLNELLQSEKSIVPEETDLTIETFTAYLKLYMNKNYVDHFLSVSSISNIDPACTEKYKILNEIDLGKKTEDFLQECEMENDEKETL